MTEKKNSKKLPVNKAEYDALVEECLRIIEEKHILFITDLVAFLPVSRSTFYNYGLDKLDSLKEVIDKQKILVKQQLRGKWFDSKSPALQIALYRMIATKEEKEAIAMIPVQKETEENRSEIPIKKMFESLRKSVKKYYD